MANLADNGLAVAICGCGVVSSLTAQGYLKLDEADDWDKAHIYAAIDPKKSSAKQKAKEWAQKDRRDRSPEDIKIFTSLKKALRDPKIDLVEIVTPNQLHLKQTRMCLEAGKHTSLQKIPAMTIPEMDEIVRLSDEAEKRGIKFHVFENFRHHPPYEKMGEILGSGVCGDLRSVYYNMVSSIGEGLLNIFKEGKLPVHDLGSWKHKLSEEGTYNSPTTFDDGYHKHSLMKLWLGDIEKVRAWRGSYKAFNVIRLDAPAVIQYKTDGKKHGMWSTTVGRAIPMKSDYYTADEFVRFDCTDGVIISNGCTGKTFEGASESGGVGEPGVYWFDRNGNWNSDCSMPTDWKYSFAKCGRYFVDETIEGSGKASLSAREARTILKVGTAVVNSARNKHQEIEVDAVDGVHGTQKDAVPWYMKPFWRMI